MGNLAWLGFLAAAGIGAWVSHEVGNGGLLVNVHGLVLVLGGVACACLVNYPVSQLRRAVTAFLRVLAPARAPSLAEAAAEILRLSGVAKNQGGLLALQGEGRGFGDGFLERALLVAIACGEERRTRDILEAEIRQSKLLRQEDGNLFRTVGTLAPMFGLLGTLVGIILVLRTMSDPTKVGPAMSIAITASLYGIAFANLVCLPVAGRIRADMLDEIRLREALMEGVLDIMRQESAYLLELRLGAYLQEPAAAAPAPAREEAPTS